MHTEIQFDLLYHIILPMSTQIFAFLQMFSQKIAPRCLKKPTYEQKARECPPILPKNGVFGYLW
jgi:hypothetical protein